MDAFFFSGTSICTDKTRVLFGTAVLRKLYALPDKKNEVLRPPDEIPPRKLQLILSSEGNVNTLNRDTTDTKMGKQEQNNVNAMNESQDIAIYNSVNIDRWKGVGHVMPKKKRSWRNTLSKLFTSCYYKAKTDAD